MNVSDFPVIVNLVAAKTTIGLIRAYIITYTISSLGGELNPSKTYTVNRAQSIQISFF